MFELIYSLLKFGFKELSFFYGIWDLIFVIRDL